MKKSVLFLFALAVGLLTTDGLIAQGTAFTYQGQLKDSGNPATGNYDFTFSLFDNSGTNTGQIGAALTNLDVGVTNGLFTVTLDFGASFSGASRWLSIGARTNDAAAFTTLNPSQEVTPAPYAIYAPTAGSAATASNITSSLAISNIVITNSVFAGNGGNLTGLSAAQLTSAGNNHGGTGNFFLAGAGNTANSGAGNTALGVGALTANTSGEFNTAIGNSALNHITTSSGNTAVGWSAMPDSATGTNNTAMGMSALQFDSTGSYNTGYGAGTLLENASGSYNIALGYQAGQSIVGSSNIDIGSLGLAADANIIRIGSTQTAAYIAGVITGNGLGLTNLSVPGTQLTSVGNNNGGTGNFFIGPAGNTANSGAGNTALGATALAANTSGEFNTAIGNSALNHITTSSGNTAVGWSAMPDSATGNNNTAMGMSALQFDSTGSYNTGYGAGTLLENATGSYNIALGYQAGQSIVGSSNIDIGSLGLAADANIIRIGSTQTAAYISGVINGSGLNVTTTAGTLAVVADQNAVPGITATGGLAAGHMRLRNAVEIWPDNAQANAGYLDVRNTANNATISLTGSSGAIVCSNLTASGMVFTSDRNAKQNFTALDPETALEKVSALAVTQWNYKTDPAGTKHIGPMAQDFHAAFGLNGGDDTHISVSDEGGVALAAIQGLNRKLEAKDAEIAALKEKAGKVDLLEKQLNELKQMVQLLAEKQ